MSQLSPESVRIDDYTYILPGEMIARFPSINRAGSKLLVYDRGYISHTEFSNIKSLAGGGGLMIFNNTRVIQARILMNNKTGSKIEIFLLEPFSPAEYNLAFSSLPGCIWKCMTGNKKRWKSGVLSREIIIGNVKVTLSARVLNDHGSWQEIEFLWEPPNHTFSRIIDYAGLTPIPPYLGRMPVDDDKQGYQTVYSRFEGSVAAPTAGLHFTADILESLRNSGTITEEITLHVGAGTFQPVRSITAGGHPMHAEHFSISAGILKKIRANPGTITAVGTTTMRTLESIYWLGVKLLHYRENTMEQMRLSQWEHLHLPSDVPAADAIDAIINRMAQKGLNEIEAKTKLMIIPGYRFRIANRLLTNFHQPGSTLLLLIAAYIGVDWRKVYDYALKNGFRFLSYGDSSLLIPGFKP